MQPRIKFDTKARQHIYTVNIQDSLRSSLRLAISEKQLITIWGRKMLMCSDILLDQF